MVSTASRIPTVSAHCSVIAMWPCRSISAEVWSAEPTSSGFRDLDGVEIDSRVVLDEINAALAADRHTRGVRGYQELA